MVMKYDVSLRMSRGVRWPRPSSTACMRTPSTPRRTLQGYPGYENTLGRASVGVCFLICVPAGRLKAKSGQPFDKKIRTRRPQIRRGSHAAPSMVPGTEALPCRRLLGGYGFLQTCVLISKTRPFLGACRGTTLSRNCFDETEAFLRGKRS